jgi:drug/metabolite transporter (DMT)-like permease
MISAPQLNTQTTGAIYLCLAMMMAAGIDVVAKLLTESFDTPQIVFLRSVFALPFALLICYQQRVIPQLRNPLWGWQIYRGLLTAGAHFGFFYGLIYLDLVTALMLAYISPVLIVLAAHFLLGEKVALKRWLGVMCAFSGVTMILDPGKVTLQPSMLAVLFSAGCWALLSISNRQLSGKIDPSVLAFFTSPISIVIAAILMWGGWQEPSLGQWGLFILIALFGAATHFFAALAYKYSDASTIAPLEYSNLLWAALAVWLIWAELPESIIWFGGTLIILGGLISLGPTSKRS